MVESQGRQLIVRYLIWGEVVTARFEDERGLRLEPELDLEAELTAARLSGQAARLAEFQQALLQQLDALTPQRARAALVRIERDIRAWQTGGRYPAASRDAATLTLLASDASWHVRTGPASRSQLPDFVLERLLRDPNPLVRWMAAKHPRVPTAEMRRLLGDPTLRVRRTARARLRARGAPALA